MDDVRPDIQRSIAKFDEHADCDYCRQPIFPFDPIFRCNVTFSTGCTEEHCRLAAEFKIAIQMS